MLRKLFKTYVCVRQHDMRDCAAACLATIAKQYRLTTSIARIRDYSGTDTQGTNVYGIIKGAEKLGFTAKGVRGDQESFFSGVPLPAIAHIITKNQQLHFFVIHYIGKKEIIVADPAQGVVKYTPAEFFAMWTGVLVILAPTQDVRKRTEVEGLFSRFWRLLKPQKSLLWNVIIASIVYTILGILGAFYFKILMDDILPYDLIKTLTVVSIGVIVLNVFRVLLSAFRAQLLLYLGQKLDLSLMLGFYRHALDLPMTFFGTRKVGEIVSRFTDASKVRSAISGAALTICVDTLMAVGGGVVLYYQSALLFEIAAIVAVLYAAIVYVFNNPLRHTNREQMENNAQLTSYLVESLTGVETVKALAAEREANLETEHKFVKTLLSVFSVGTINNIRLSLTSLLALTGGTVILWVGAYNVINGKMTIGALLAFNALLTYFLDPIKRLIDLQPSMQAAIVAAERLGDVLDLEPEVLNNEDRNIVPNCLKGNIEFRGVNFRYGTRELALRDINLSIPEGCKIGIVGESGSGKTTLAKLLLNFYKCEKGEVLINGYNIDDINLESLRRRIAYISQGTFLFSQSIRDNLSFGLDDIGLEEIINAAKAAGAHDFINRLPLRYDTLLEENGANLSGGQRQLLAITRAVLKKADILVMDEATSNLDSHSERVIQSAIRDQFAGVTTIIIAHRLATVVGCDKIHVLDKGFIVESGTHDELIHQKGLYYGMWEGQFPAQLQQAFSFVFSEEVGNEAVNMGY